MQGERGSGGRGAEKSKIVKEGIFFFHNLFGPVYFFFVKEAERKEV